MILIFFCPAIKKYFLRQMYQPKIKIQKKNLTNYKAILLEFKLSS